MTRRRAFTLIELLVALSLFGIIFPLSGWLIYILISSLFRAAGANQGGHMMRPMPGDGDMMMQLMSSVFLMGAFLYAMWCVAGVGVAYGFDRAIVVFESLVATIRERRNRPAIVQAED